MKKIWKGCISLGNQMSWWSFVLTYDEDIHQSVICFHRNIERETCAMEGGVIWWEQWAFPHWNIGTDRPEDVNTWDLPFTGWSLRNMSYMGEFDGFPTALFLELEPDSSRPVPRNIFSEQAPPVNLTPVDETETDDCDDMSLFSSHYDDDITYYGQHEYHYHHGEDYNACTIESEVPWKFGIELEVECNSEDDKDSFTSYESNWFYHEEDGSLSDDGDEIITVPLAREDALNPDFWKPLVHTAKKYATSWDERSTGLHVHIGREILGNTDTERSETLGKLLFFYHHCIGEDSEARRINEKLYGRAHTYSEHDGKTKEGSAVSLLGRNVLSVDSVKDTVKKSLLDHNSDTRYYDINLRNDATIEFRKGKGSICVRRIVAICAWSEALVLYCKEHDWKDLNFREFLAYAKRNQSVAEILR